MRDIVSPISGFSSPIGQRRFSVRDLFRRNEPGVWYDPSDLTTMFQDRAGTTPVTAPGQTVGLVLDKSRGSIGRNGAFRRNLLTFTEQFDNAAWTKARVGGVDLGPIVTANTVTAPDGTLTADTVDFNTTNGQFVRQTQAFTAGATGTISVWAYAPASGGSPSIRITTNNTGAWNTGVSQSFALTTGWNRLSVTGVLIASGSLCNVIIGGANVDGTADASVSGIVYLWGAQMEAAASASEYQRIDADWPSTFPGAHLVANADAARGLYGIEPLGGRRNLLERSEEFDNAYWTKGNSAVTANAGVAPDGTTTADLLYPSTTGSDRRVIRTFTTLTSGASYASTFYAKAAGKNFVYALVARAATINDVVWFNVGAGTVGTVGSSATSATIADVGDGWYRCAVIGPADGTDSFAINVADADNATNVTASGTDGILIWGAQLEAAASASAYQKVVTALEVTEAGKPSLPYILFDGADDGYVTPTITPGTDKVQLFAGVRRNTEHTGMITEFSPTTDTNNGGLHLAIVTPNTRQAASRGTIGRTATSVGAAAPQTEVLSTISDIPADIVTLRSNGVAVNTNAFDQGTGNYLAYPLFVGRRGGTTLPFNGRLYQLAVRFGPNLDTSRIEQVERFVAQKTGVVI